MSQLSDVKIPDLNAAILPGRSAAGIEIGSAMTESEVRPDSVRRLAGCTVFDFKSVSVWIKDGLVTQIGVHAAYEGALGQMIRIGSTLAEVSQWAGCKIIEDEEENLVLECLPGCSFETSDWAGEEIKNNMNAPITWIFVCPASDSAARDPA
jgi:hypothetical protein